MKKTEYWKGRDWILSEVILRQLDSEGDSPRRRTAGASLPGRGDAEVLPAALLVVNKSGNARFVSSAAAAILGRSPKALLGAPIGVPLYAGETTEMDIVRPDGVPLVAEFRAMRGLWEEEEAWFLFLRDVTRRRAALEEAA